MLWRASTVWRILGRAAFALAVLAFGGTARASHYDLSAIDLVGEPYLQRLQELGIETTEDLLKATSTRAKVSKLAKKLGVKVEVVQEWADFCDVLQVQGIGPKVVRVLRHLHIRRLRDLAGWDPKLLTKRIAEVNEKVEILGKLPDEATVAHWISEAKRILKGPPTKGRR